MKKLLSIIMCGLLFYNMIGFSLIYWAEENAVFERIQLHYEEKNTKHANELLEADLAMSLPYPTTWQEAELSDEGFRKGDDFYKIVEKRIENGNLKIKYKLDIAARDRFENLAAHVENFVKDKTSDTHKKHSTFLKNFLKDYLSINRKHIVYLWEWLSHSTISSQIIPQKFSVYSSLVSPPPRS